MIKKELFEKVKKLLALHEGREKKPYKDTATPPKWTIGVGWNITDNPLPVFIKRHLREYGEITEEMIDQLLDISIERTVKDCEDLFPEFDLFSDNRKMALIDVVFNLGKCKIRYGFKRFVHNVNIKDWQEAADELKYVDGRTDEHLSNWWKQLHGDPDGTDDGKVERPETIYNLLVKG